MELPYPKEVTLRDGTKGAIRLLNRNDAEKLYEMFSELKPEARRFLYDDVTKMSVVKSWTQNINYKAVLPLVMDIGGKIVADGTLNRRSSGPLRHVGRIRVVVHGEYHGKGVGTIITRELIEIARLEGLKTLSCTHAEFEEGPAIQTLKALGFRRVALVPNYLIDPEGETHAMAILTLNIK